MKSRARDPGSLTHGGYQIVDPITNGLIAGHDIGRGYGLDLDQVEAWMEER